MSPLLPHLSLLPSLSLPSLLGQSNVDSGSGDIPREHSTCVAPRSRVNDRARASRRAAERRARKSFYCRRGALRVKERRGDGDGDSSLPLCLFLPGDFGIERSERWNRGRPHFPKRRENYKCNERCSPPSSPSPSPLLPLLSHVRRTCC